MERLARLWTILAGRLRRIALVVGVVHEIVVEVPPIWPGCGRFWHVVFDEVALVVGVVYKIVVEVPQPGDVMLEVALDAAET